MADTVTISVLKRQIKAIGDILDNIHQKSHITLTVEFDKSIGNLTKFSEKIATVKQEMKELRDEAKMDALVRSTRQSYTELRDLIRDVVNYSKQVTQELKTHITIIKAVNERKEKVGKTSTAAQDVIVRKDDATKVLELSKAFKNFQKEVEGSTVRAKSWVNYFKIVRKVQLEVQDSTASLTSQLRVFIKLAVGAKALAPMTSIFSQLASTVNKYTGGLMNLIYWQARWYATKTLIFGTVAAFKDAVKTFIEFDQQLRNIQAISNATAKEIARLNTVIVQVAQQTKFGLADIAEAARIFAQAGFSIQETINALPVAASLATATLTKLETTVGLITSTIRAFDVQLTDTARIADIFANAVSNSKLNIEGIATAFNYVGPVAKQVGLTLEDTVAVMAQLANRGIQFSTIGTSLRTLFGSLLAPTEKLKTQLQKVGLTVSDINPQLYDFREILQRMQDAGLSINEIFSGLDRRAAGALAAIVSEGADSFERMRNSLIETGAASRKAQTQLLGLQQIIDNLKQNIEVFFMSLIKYSKFGQILVNVFDNLRTRLLDINNYFSSAEGIRSIDNFMQQLIKKVTFGINTIGILIGSKLAFGIFNGLRTFLSTFSLLPTLLKLTTGPIGLAVTVLGTILGGLFAKRFVSSGLDQIQKLTINKARDIQEALQQEVTIHTRTANLLRDIQSIQDRLVRGEINREEATARVNDLIASNKDILAEASEEASKLGISLSDVANLGFSNVSDIENGIQAGIDKLKEFNDLLDKSILSREVKVLQAKYLQTEVEKVFKDPIIQDTALTGLEALFSDLNNKLESGTISGIDLVGIIQEQLSGLQELSPEVSNVYRKLFGTENVDIATQVIVDKLNNAKTQGKDLNTVLEDIVDTIKSLRKPSNNIIEILDPDRVQSFLTNLKPILTNQISSTLFANKSPEVLAKLLGDPEEFKKAVRKNFNQAKWAILDSIEDPEIRAQVSRSFSSIFNSDYIEELAINLGKRARTTLLSEFQQLGKQLGNFKSVIKEKVTGLFSPVKAFSNQFSKLFEIKGLEKLINDANNKIATLTKSLKSLSDETAKIKLTEQKTELERYVKFVQSLLTPLKNYYYEFQAIRTEFQKASVNVEKIYPTDNSQLLENTNKLVQTAKQLLAGELNDLSDEQRALLSSLLGVNAVQEIIDNLKNNEGKLSASLRGALEEIIKAGFVVSIKQRKFNFLAVFKDQFTELKDQTINTFAQLKKAIIQQLKIIDNTSKIHIENIIFGFKKLIASPAQLLNSIDITKKIKLQEQAKVLENQFNYLERRKNDVQKEIDKITEEYKSKLLASGKFKSADDENFKRALETALRTNSEYISAVKLVGDLSTKLQDVRTKQQDNLAAQEQYNQRVQQILQILDDVVEGRRDLLSLQDRINISIRKETDALKEQVDLYKYRLELTKRLGNKDTTLSISMQGVGTSATEDELSAYSDLRKKLQDINTEYDVTRYKYQQLLELRNKQIEQIKVLKDALASSEDPEQIKRITEELNATVAAATSTSKKINDVSRQLSNLANQRKSISQLAKEFERVTLSAGLLNSAVKGIKTGFKDWLQSFISANKSAASTIARSTKQVFDSMSSHAQQLFQDLLYGIKNHNRKVEEEKRRSLEIQQQQYEQELYNLNLKLQMGEVNFEQYQKSLVSIEQENLRKRAEINKKAEKEKRSALEGTKAAIKDFWKDVFKIIMDTLTRLIIQYAVAAAWRALAIGASAPSAPSAPSVPVSGVTMSAAKGGVIPRYATGGQVINISKYFAYAPPGGFLEGGVPGKDSVLTMTMPGEYVVRKSSVDKFGVDFFHKLNAGFFDPKAIKRYASGGQVTKSGPSYRTNTTESETQVVIYNVIDPTSIPKQPGPEDIINVIRVDAMQNGPGIQTIRQTIRG